MYPPSRDLGPEELGFVGVGFWEAEVKGQTIAEKGRGVGLDWGLVIYGECRVSLSPQCTWM